MSGVAASAVGLVDYVTVKQVHRLPSARVHAGGNALALALTALNLARRDPRDRTAPDGVDLALSAGVLALLGVTAWLGGELSYRHGIGVIASDSPTATEDLARLAARTA